MSHIVDDKKEERSIEDLLKDILLQLKINNLYLQSIVGEKITEQDVED